MCLAMCLIFKQSEPSVLINRVLIKKRMCIIDSQIVLCVSVIICVHVLDAERKFQPQPIQR